MARFGGLTVHAVNTAENGSLSELENILLNEVHEGEGVTCSSVQSYMARNLDRRYNILTVSTILNLLTEKGAYKVIFSQTEEHAGPTKVFIRC